jgi:hypothetical protein
MLRWTSMSIRALVMRQYCHVQVQPAATEPTSMQEAEPHIGVDQPALKRKAGQHMNLIGSP